MFLYSDIFHLNPYDDGDFSAVSAVAGFFPTLAILLSLVTYRKDRKDGRSKYMASKIFAGILLIVFSAGAFWEDLPVLTTVASGVLI